MILNFLVEIQYLNFREDIKSLAEALSQLEAILNNAGKHRQARPWQVRGDAFQAALQVLPDVTGNFRKTLEDCEKLLLQHAKLQQGQSNLVSNFRWWSSAERDVNILRERVKFHVTKVALIAKPFELQLLQGIQRDLQLLRRDVKQLTGIVTNGVGHYSNTPDPYYLSKIDIVQEVACRFEAASSVNRPPSFTKEADWPVKEGFDALVLHFCKSTVEFNPRPDLGHNVPDGPQYLNLLKALWIRGRLRGSQYFQAVSNNSLWAEYMSELEDEMRDQFALFDDRQLVAPAADVITRLPDEYYQIWQSDEPRLRSLEIAEQRPLEDKILEATLPTPSDLYQSTLTIFRKSDVAFRLVTTTKKTDNPFYHDGEGTPVHMNITRLIPVYGDPDNAPSMAFNVALCNSQSQDLEWYIFRDFHDVKNFQWALTGYRIQEDFPTISWCINGSRDADFCGRGRLQLWQYKPMPRIIPDNERSNSFSVASPQSPSSETSFHAGFPASRNPSVASAQSPLGGVSLSQQMSAFLPELEASQKDHGRSTSGGSIGSAEANASSPTLHRPSTIVSLASTLAHPGSPKAEKHSSGKSTSLSLSGTSVASPVSGPSGNGTELVKPEVPVLIIFTRCGGKLAFIHIKCRLSPRFAHI